ncbi:MAG: hypothetical protein GX605_14275, partial [Chloroflexi bacterium]|nr:hypothetical protein [Chloroflexota bacterium]
YREAGERVRLRAEPEFVPGEQIEVAHTWPLLPGDLPPGTEIEYYWSLETSGGQTLETDPVVLVYRDDRFPWQEMVSGTLVVHWYGVPESRARDLLHVAEEALGRLEGDVGLALSRPVHIYLYQSRDDMKLVVPSRSETFDSQVLTLGMAVSDDTMLVLASSPGVEGVLAHELSHIVVGLATRNPLGGLPRWLDEGLAMYAEGELPLVNRLALEEALRSNRLISVRSLSAYTNDPAEVDLYYAQVYSVVKSLVDVYGREPLQALLQEFKAGAHQEDALQKVYGFGLDELDAAWRQHVKAQPRQALATSAPTGVPRERSNETPRERGLCLGGLLPGLLLVFPFRQLRRGRLP